MTCWFACTATFSWNSDQIEQIAEYFLDYTLLNEEKRGDDMISKSPEFHEVPLNRGNKISSLIWPYYVPVLIRVYWTTVFNLETYWTGLESSFLRQQTHSATEENLQASNDISRFVQVLNTGRHNGDSKAKALLQWQNTRKPDGFYFAKNRPSNLNGTVPIQPMIRNWPIARLNDDDNMTFTNHNNRLAILLIASL